MATCSNFWPLLKTESSATQLCHYFHCTRLWQFNFRVYFYVLVLILRLINNWLVVEIGGSNFLGISLVETRFQKDLEWYSKSPTFTTILIIGEYNFPDHISTWHPQYFPTNANVMCHTGMKKAQVSLCCVSNRTDTGIGNFVFCDMSYGHHIGIGIFVLFVK